MSDNISQIKERLNVVDVISGYIKVQKSGVNFKARCPFHNEKTPSFYISPERQIWHCFGCQKGGDVFGFVKEIEGVEFPEALRMLAQKAGVKLHNFDPSIKDKKAVLYEITEVSAKFFEKQLHHSSVGKKAFNYLKERGMSEDTITEFRLGFAPDDWHGLSNFLRDCGYQEKDIVESGLAIKKETGGDIYDRFRSRIIFPIADIHDQVVGFTGRVFEYAKTPEFPGHKAVEPGAKYINTPQTSIYDKSRVLYCLNKGKTEARQADRCLLVEGNMDAIMSYQAGVKNVAATSGTALTPSHLQLLQRYTSNLDFCFDTDQAGLVATRRGLGLALSQNLNVKIIPLKDPDCKDPADYVKKFGEKWQELVKTAKPVVDFYFEKLSSEFDLASVEGKKAVIASLGPLIRRLTSRVERSHWISKLAVAFKTKEDAIEADILSAKDDLDVYIADQPKKISEQKVPEVKPVGDMLLEALLAVIIRKPLLFKDHLPELRPELLNGPTADIVSEIKKTNLDNFKFGKFSERFENAEKMHLEFSYLKAQEFLSDFSDEDLVAEFNNIRNKLERRALSVQLAGLEFDIKAAEAGKDKVRLAVLLKDFDKLAKDLNKN